MTSDDQDRPIPPVDGDVPGDEATVEDAASEDRVSGEEAESAEGVETVAADADEADAADVEDGLEPVAAEEAPAEEDAPRLDPEELVAILEALVFASPEPLGAKPLAKIVGEDLAAVSAALGTLGERYGGQGGLHLVEVAGGYQITTRPEFHEWVRRLFHERTTQKLSVQALETLAVVAYKQPITAAEVGEIRGVNTSGVLSTLLDRHLVKIVGRKNVIGRPFLYGTTREFLIRFGLKDVGDLPKVEDMAQALGFDAPAILRERAVPEEMLPLEEADREPEPPDTGA